jgi:hypothetical protein
LVLDVNGFGTFAGVIGSLDKPESALYHRVMFYVTLGFVATILMRYTPKCLILQVVNTKVTCENTHKQYILSRSE